MKITYKSLLTALVATLLLTSCGNRDIFNNIVEAGQEVPTAYWEVGSTACKAGESFTFQGKYTVSPGKTAAYSEVWYRVNRDESAAATVKLGGAAFSYTKSYSATDTMRAYQPVVHLDHSQAEFDGYEYVIKGEIPVSRTLSPVSWIDAQTWDQERFDSYYPKGFAAEFCDEVVEYLTKDSTYYNSLRTVYINYPFSNDLVKQVNAKYGTALPDNVDLTQEDGGSGDKSDLWFSTTEASDDAIVGYYYFDLVNGNNIVHEIAKDAPTFNADGTVTYNGATCYPVYKSSPWVFCRYNDDLGAIISTVRAQYMPAFKEMLQTISFQDWIYDSANKVYKVEFTRKYSLESQFRVYDTDGQEGIANDRRVITIN